MCIHGLLFTGSCFGRLIASKRIIVDLNNKIIIYHLESTKSIAQKQNFLNTYLLITPGFSLLQNNNKNTLKRKIHSNVLLLQIIINLKKLLQRSLTFHEEDQTFFPLGQVFFLSRLVVFLFHFFTTAQRNNCIIITHVSLEFIIALLVYT